MVVNFNADSMVNEVIILELKSFQAIIMALEVPLVNYLTATAKPVGRLLKVLAPKSRSQKKS